MTLAELLTQQGFVWSEYVGAEGGWSRPRGEDFEDIILLNGYGDIEAYAVRTEDGERMAYSGPVALDTLRALPANDRRRIPARTD